MSAENWQMLLDGLAVTVGLSVISILLSLLLGTLLGILRISPLALLRVPTMGYVEFFRNIPLLIVLFFIYFGLPFAGVRFSSFVVPGTSLRVTSEMQAAILGLAVYHAAYVTEVVRAGLQAIDPGQFEAARALGLTYVQMVRFVLLPQAFRTTLPPLGNVFIALSKNTSIASAISVFELVKQADTIEARTFSSTPFIAAGLMYLVLTVPLSLAVNALEARLAVHGRRGR